MATDNGECIDITGIGLAGNELDDQVRHAADEFGHAIDLDESAQALLVYGVYNNARSVNDAEKQLVANHLNELATILGGVSQSEVVVKLFPLGKLRSDTEASEDYAGNGTEPDTEPTVEESLKPLLAEHIVFLNRMMGSEDIANAIASLDDAQRNYLIKRVHQNLYPLVLERAKKGDIEKSRANVQEANRKVDLVESFINGTTLVDMARESGKDVKEVRAELNRLADRFNKRVPDFTRQKIIAEAQAFLGDD